MGKLRVKQDLNFIESYFILLLNHPRLKKELKRIYTPFNLILTLLRKDQATITNTEHQARLDEVISGGEIWLRATTINGCLILKLTLAWCMYVISLKVRYLGLEWNSSNFLPKWNSSNFLPKYLALRRKTPVHQARLVLK